MGSLKRNATGHLLRHANGHLMRECCCSGACACDPWPPFGLAAYPCWPCHGFHYQYTVTISARLTDGTTDADHDYVLTMTADPSNACCWLVPEPSPPNCCGHGSGACASGEGYLQGGSVCWNATDELWHFVIYFFMQGLEVPGASYEFTAPGITGPYTYVSGTHCVGDCCASIEALTVAGGTSPTCAEITCDTDTANWTLLAEPFASKAAFCAAYPGVTPRHIKFGTVETWVDGDSPPMAGWSYSKSWTDGDCDCSATGMAMGLTGVADVTVTCGACTYQTTCPVPALEIDELEAC